jgi:hypothetical protein
MWWAILALVVAGAAACAMQLLRAFRELKRLGSRVAALADHPVFEALVRAEQDANRIASALEQVEPLVARAQIAIATIRRGPIPADVIQAFRGLKTAIAVVRATIRVANAAR